MEVLSSGKNMTFEIWRGTSSTGDLAVLCFLVCFYCVTSGSHLAQYSHLSNGIILQSYKIVRID